jgi:peptidoglycan hydrolase-like protein with peptidoglycan-binding domain
MTNRVVAIWAVALGLALVAPVPAATAADVKDKAVETKDTLKEKAIDAKDTIKEKAVDAKDTIKDKAVEAKDKIKETTAAAKDKIKSKFDRDKDRTAKVDHSATMSVREAQSSLKAKGFDPGPIDGVFGPRTRVAVQDFQRSQNLTVSGQLDADTSARLSLAASRGGHTDSTAPSASPTTGTEKKESLKDKAVDAKETIKDKAVDAKETIKDKAVDAKETIKEKTAAVKDKVKSKMSRHDKDRPMAVMDVRQAQSSLKAKGFDPGPIDGVFGPRTRVAVQDFQRSEGLTITGQLDAETSARLSSMSRTSHTGPAAPSASPATTMEPPKDQPTPPTARETGQRSRQAP